LLFNTPIGTRKDFSKFIQNLSTRPQKAKVKANQQGLQMELPCQLLVHAGNVRSFGGNINIKKKYSSFISRCIHVGLQENNEKRSVHVWSKYSDSLSLRG